VNNLVPAVYNLALVKNFVCNRKSSVGRKDQGRAVGCRQELKRNVSSGWTDRGRTACLRRGSSRRTFGRPGSLWRIRRVADAVVKNSRQSRGSCRRATGIGRSSDVSDGATGSQFQVGPGGSASVGYGRDRVTVEAKAAAESAKIRPARRKPTDVRKGVRESARESACGGRRPEERQLRTVQSYHVNGAGQNVATTTRDVNFDKKISYVHDLSLCCI
jgi:hypothetical protein